jgi:transcriptional regulator with XRE-family HTH domain
MFPQRLRLLRKEKKLTSKEFGKLFQLAESTISGYETGARKPDLETIEKFADYFAVSVDYLSGRSEIRNAEEIASRSDSRNLDEGSLIRGRAYYDGGKDWTPEEIELADAFIKGLRQGNKKNDKQG